MSGFGGLIGNYVRRALAYRWAVLIPTVLVFALVTLFITIQPDTYESHAVLMQPLGSPAEGGTRQDSMEVAREMFRSATERLLSTNTLLHVVEKLDPFPETRELMGVEAVIAKLRKQIRIEVRGSAGSITVYCEHAEGEHPAQMAADIVNTITGMLVQSEHDALEEKVANYKKFLDSEHTRLNGELDKSQKRLENFRIAHAGKLPEDVAMNRAQITLLRQQILDNRQNQRAHEFEVSRLHREVARLETELAYASERGPITVRTALDAAERTLTALRLELKRMKLRYSEGHEYVSNQEKLIAQIEAEVEDLKSTDEQTDSSRKREEYLRYLQDENRKLIQRHTEEDAHLDTAITLAQDKIKEAEARIVEATKLRSQYLALQREHANWEEKYSSVVGRQAEADNRLRYSDYYGAAPIEVEQAAMVSALPKSPNRFVMSMLGLVLGLGLGIALAIAQYRAMNTTYHQSEDLRALMPGAVLVTIPDVHRNASRVGKTILGVLGGLVLVGLFLATVGLLGIQMGWWGHLEMITTLTNLR